MLELVATSTKLVLERSERRSWDQRHLVVMVDGEEDCSTKAGQHAGVIP